jgi:hypothetical protein
MVAFEISLLQTRFLFILRFPRKPNSVCKMINECVSALGLYLLEGEQCTSALPFRELSS